MKNSFVEHFCKEVKKFWIKKVVLSLGAYPFSPLTRLPDETYGRSSSSIFSLNQFIYNSSYIIKYTRQ